MTMRRLFGWSWIVVSCLILLTSGCGNDPFGAPSRPKSSPTIGEAESPKPAFIVYVVPGMPTGDLEVWGARAQHEANDKRAIFRIMGPGPGDDPVKQPEIVRKAVAEGASALLVSPGDSPELPQALAEAESKGVPVVLIDRPITAPEGSKPFTVVEHAPFGETARKIVATTIEDLKKASQPINGTALVLADKVVDGSSARRVSALRTAAEKAQFKQVITVPIDGSDEDLARKSVLEAVKAHPDVSIILTDDGEGLVAAAMVRSELQGKTIFFVGGYTDYRTTKLLQLPIRESCYVEGRYTELGGLAVLTALARLRGEPAKDHAYLTPKFTRTDGSVASAGESTSPVPVSRAAESLKDILKDIEPPKAAKKPQ